MINTIPKESLVKLAKKNAKFVVGEMQWQEENLDFEEVAKRVIEWNMENERKIIRKEKKGLVSFKQRHDLGLGWSTHQCEMYAEMFRLINETVVPNSVKYGKDSFSFEIFKHDEETV